MKHVMKIILEIKDIKRKEFYLNTEDSNQMYHSLSKIPEKIYDGENLTSSNLTINENSNELNSSFMEFAHKNKISNPSKIDRKKNRKASYDLKNISIIENFNKYYFKMANENVQDSINFKESEDNKENLNIDNISRKINITENFDNLVENSYLNIENNPKVIFNTVSNKNNNLSLKFHKKNNSMDLDISPSYNKKFTDFIYKSNNNNRIKKNKIDKPSNEIYDKNKYQTFSTKTLLSNKSKSPNKSNNSRNLNDFKIPLKHNHNYLNNDNKYFNCNTNKNIDRYNLKEETDYIENIKQNDFNQSFDFNKSADILNIKKTRNKISEKEFLFKDSDKIFRTYSGLRKNEINNFNIVNKELIGFDDYISSFKIKKEKEKNELNFKSLSKEKSEIRKQMDEEFSGVKFNKSDINYCNRTDKINYLTASKDKLNKSYLDYDELEQNSISKVNNENSSSKNSLLHLKRNERKLNLMKSNGKSII